MGNPQGFIEFRAITPERRPVAERIHDWKEVYKDFPEDQLKVQASRCMDCGIPFCNQGCPLGNIIPDWNDLVYRGRWSEAIKRLHATNNFPEFTGRVCPAPCEGSCVLGINADPVTIKQVEVTIIEEAFKNGWVQAAPPAIRTGKKVAVVGSGPAGLAAAAQLNQAGHWVTVFERADRIGGLLRYGIPEFKMEKSILDRRLDIMTAEGVTFQTNANVGVNVAVEDLRKNFDALLLAGGATLPRDLPFPDANSMASTLRWTICRCRTNAAKAMSFRTISSFQRRARRWSSSAAATPAPTASAPRTARAPTPSSSSNCCPSLRHTRHGQSLAQLAEHFQDLVGSRGRRRSRVFCVQTNSSSAKTDA